MNFPIKNIDPKSEAEYLQKVLPALKNFALKGGKIVLFDIDGTMISQDETGQTYTRNAFDQAYKKAQTHRLKIGISPIVQKAMEKLRLSPTTFPTTLWKLLAGTILNI